MRAATWVLGIAAIAVVACQASAAPIYPWCTTGAGTEFGATNCGFVSFEQCMDTARGNGQMCQQNPYYEGQPKPAPRVQKPSRTRSKLSR